MTSSRSIDRIIPQLGVGLVVGQRAAAGVALAQQRRGAPDRVDFDAAGGEPDRVGDAFGAGGAVADDRHRAQPEQDRAAGRVGVELFAKPPIDGFSSSPPAAAIGFLWARSEIALASIRAAPSITFSDTLPVKPSVTTMSTFASGRSAPSTLPANLIPGAAARIRCASTISCAPSPPPRRRSAGRLSDRARRARRR